MQSISHGFSGTKKRKKETFLLILRETFVAGSQIVIESETQNSKIKETAVSSLKPVVSGCLDKHFDLSDIAANLKLELTSQSKKQDIVELMAGKLFAKK